MPSINEIIRDETISHSVRMLFLSNGEAKWISEYLIENVYPEVLDRIAQRLATDAVTTTSGTNALALSALYADIQRVLRSGHERAAIELLDRLQTIGESELLWQVRTIESPISAAGVPVGMVLVQTPDIAMLRGAVNRPFDGLTLNQWMDSLTASAALKIERAVNNGVAAGESINQIISRVRGSRAGRGAMDLTRKDAEAIVRTAVTHVSTSARELVYQENSSILSGVQWVSTLDSRTTVICASLDGKVFKIGEGPRPPAHLQCRSTTVPVVKSWKSLGLPLRELPTGTRASFDGQVAGDITFPKWLRSRTKAEQLEVLGDARYRLWKSGIPIESFVNDDLRVLTIQEILKREGLAEVPAA